MESRIGRKSTFSQGISSLREPQNTTKEGMLVEKESHRGIVLDICSAYKQKSIFIDENYRGFSNFKTGIFFIVGLFGREEVAIVAWKRGEDELRSTYGSDRNIIGRECTLICSKSTPDAYLKGELVFNSSLGSGIKSFNQSEYMSNSFISGMPTNYTDQLKGVNEESGFGEVWREVKLT